MADIQNQNGLPDTPPATILIVDDIEENQKLLTRYLGKRGFRTVVAGGGAEALDIVEQDLPDLVLLDIMMPVVDGFEVLTRLREKFSPGELPIIMLTALDDQKSVVHSLSLGANDYLTKPIDFPVLDARCSSQLKRKVAEREVRELNVQLEKRVETRTAELRRAYDVLKAESNERKNAQESLRRREEMYRTLYDDNPMMFFTVDANHTIVSVNKFGASHLGFDVGDLIGSSVRAIHVDGDATIVEDAIAECLQDAGDTRIWEASMRHKDGSITWGRSTGKRVQNPDGSSSVLVVCEDIGEARYLSERLSHEARHDAHTGLYNRQEFELRLERAFGAIKEDKDLRHTLCYINLDQFKVINDNCGLVGGDEMLQQLAGVLLDNLRDGDVVGRLGGDEFGFVLANCSEDCSERMAEDLRKAIESFRFSWDGKIYSVSASLGVVTIDDSLTSISQIMQAAVSACYVAKDAGRNRVHVYRPDDEQLAQRHGEMGWIIKIKRALEQDRFALFAQPIVPLAKDAGDTLHYEILIRMLDDEGKPIPPGAFLPAAERYNISGSIDRWVVHSTLAWLQEHKDHLDRLDVCSVNLSGQTLGDKLLLNEILTELSDFSVPPEKLCFEITETAAIENWQVAMEFITTLKKRGCQFALDDFGSGLSSFAYLKNLPVDYLKIDGIFVKNVVEDAVDLAIVQSITDVARALGKKTIAEFVENDAIIEKLRGVGVDYGQGYGIGKPIAIGELQVPFAALK